MAKFKIKTQTTYWWNDKQITFTPESESFDNIHSIDSRGASLEFTTYEHFTLKHEWESYEKDCLRFAEAISGARCKITYTGLGTISTIKIIKSESTW